jgi:metal-dependent amidase/aminoacylase/carboxypeptidase family protein
VRLPLVRSGRAWVQIVKGRVELHEPTGSTTTPHDVVTLGPGDGAAIVGEANVERDRSLVMASEDFGFMLQACPGAFMFIGNAGPDGTGASPVHTPTYDFNDDALPLGMALYVRLAETRLAPGG